MRHDHAQRDFLLGAMIGGTLGALTVMAFTTKKGKEIQEKILDKYDSLACKVKSYANGKKRKVKSQLKKYANQADRKVVSISKKVRKKIKKTKKRIEET